MWAFGKERKRQREKANNICCGLAYSILKAILGCLERVQTGASAGAASITIIIYARYAPVPSANQSNSHTCVARVLRYYYKLNI